MTRKKPWNRVDLPVYSICSSDGDHFNMHIITYVTASSMHPKNFACCIYEGTKTLDNVEKNGHFVLQLLADTQYRLIDLLGKKSGRDTDKISRMNKRGLLRDWKGFPVLKDALAVMEMRVIGKMEGGDHRIFLCETVSWQNLQEGQPLTLDKLREKKLIRI